MAKNKSKAREAVSLAADFVSTFITTIIVIAAIAIVALRLMGWNMYSVDSYSMTPTYPINSLVVVKPVEPETIQVGDVITYVLNMDGVLVTHRVTAIDKSNQTFTTKGDANESEDASPILWGNVVGKVVIGIPELGAILRVLTSEENRPIVIGVIAGLLVLSFGWDIVSGIRKKRKNVKSEAEETVPEAEEIIAPDSGGKAADDTFDEEIRYIDVDDIRKEKTTPETDLGEKNDKE
ncbi:MAG: signal peptidase I [Clostridiales bacterium]|nr:signal peptidase I [Clostridiales bacterium]